MLLRRVRIRSGVSEDVVPAVIRHPTDRSPLVRHRAERDDDELERSAGGERPMGEKPMEADRDAVTDEQVESHREEHVPEVDAVAPELDHTAHEGDEGDSDEQKGHCPPDETGWALVLLDRQNRRGGWRDELKRHRGSFVSCLRSG